MLNLWPEKIYRIKIEAIPGIFLKTLFKIVVHSFSYMTMSSSKRCRQSGPFASIIVTFFQVKYTSAVLLFVKNLSILFIMRLKRV